MTGTIASAQSAAMPAATIVRFRAIRPPTSTDRTAATIQPRFARNQAVKQALPRGSGRDGLPVDERPCAARADEHRPAGYELEPVGLGASELRGDGLASVDVEVDADVVAQVQ